jgi:small-conductance mechanosensitive channel
MPAPSASAGAPLPVAAAKLHDTTVFTLHVDAGGKAASERARAASEALVRTADAQSTDEIRVAQQGDVFVIYAGPSPVVVLYPEDAVAAGAPDLATHAAAIAARVSEVVAAERRRSAIAGTVFSFSLLVFFGLIAFYVLQKVGQMFHAMRQWMLDNPDRVKGLSVQDHEVVGATAIRGGVLVALILGRFVAQLGVVYVWLVFALSLFQSTRPYTTKLTSLVVTPLSDLAGRLAASLPVAVVGVVSGVALYILLRFIQLFFEGVARRQTTLPWLPADLAPATSVLIRLGVVIGAFVFAAPIVTGDREGPLAHTGIVAVLALGLACTPLVASFVVGAVVIYGRRVRIGQHVEIGGRSGRVTEVGLFDVKLRDAAGSDVRVPHLLTLVHPTQVMHDAGRLTFSMPVAPTAGAREARMVLAQALERFGERPEVELDHVDADGLHFKVTIEGGGAKLSEVRLALLDALGEAGIGLGRRRRTEAPP